MSTWSDLNSAAVTNWISELPPRSDEHSATLLTTTNEKLCIASASAYPPRSIPSLANSASTPESEETSTQSRKRKRGDIEQDHLEQAQKRTHQQNKHLTAEHRKEERLVAAYLGTVHTEAGNTVADFQAEQFESRNVGEEYFGVEQSVPEYFEMDEDRASVAGSNPSLISNRPILEAKPPSRRSSRSTSPIRSTLALLRSAAPPIDICQPGPAAATSPGEAVNKLKGFLLDGYDKAFIPRQLEARLREIAPDEAIALHDAMFDDDHGYTTEELESLWGNIQDICYEANACSNLLKDENAWVQVVRSVLKLAGIHALSQDLELNSVQSQSVESQYLPTLPLSPTSLSKKADLALIISPRQTDSTINQWRKENPGVGLSHMSDAYTREMLLACPLEVKRQGGDYNEAVCQLGVWSAAALEKLKILAGMGRDKEMLEGFPYPGWTVVGYEWQLHISWKEDSGKVVVFGPYQLLSAKVNSYLDMFRLRRLLSKLQRWLLEDYKSWILGHVLGPR